MCLLAMFVMPNEILAFSSLSLECKDSSTLSVWPQIQSHADDVKKLAEKLRQRHSAEDTLLEGVRWEVSGLETVTM